MSTNFIQYEGAQNEGQNDQFIDSEYYENSSGDEILFGWERGYEMHLRGHVSF